MAQANQQQSVWKVDSSPAIQSYTLANLRKLPQLENFSEEQIFEMEVVGNVLPFKANNYVVEQLIDWDNVPGDSMFNLTFPQKGMLKPEHYDMMASVLKNGSDRKDKVVKEGDRVQLESGYNGYVHKITPRVTYIRHGLNESVAIIPTRQLVSAEIINYTKEIKLVLLILVLLLFAFLNDLVVYFQI